MLQKCPEMAIYIITLEVSIFVTLFPSVLRSLLLVNLTRSSYFFGINPSVRKHKKKLEIVICKYITMVNRKRTHSRNQSLFLQFGQKLTHSILLMTFKSRAVARFLQHFRQTHTTIMPRNQSSTQF